MCGGLFIVSCDLYAPENGSDWENAFHWTASGKVRRAGSGRLYTYDIIMYCYIYLSSVFRSVWTTTELLFVSVGCGDGLWVGDWGGSRIPPLVPSASHPPQRAEPYFPMSPATQHQNPSSGEVGCGAVSAI